ncbi:DUF6029 family protein [Flavobacteriaceae bacterium LMO-SS05]
MKIKLLFYSLLVFHFFSFAQENNQISGSLESFSEWYIDDNKTEKFNEENHFRSNNYLNIDYYFKKFITNVKFESYAPQALLNYSPSLNKSFGIASFSFKYKTDKLDLTIGDFYDQFGSGLIYRSWEDRILGLDNSIHGFNAHYNPKDLHLTSFIGKQRYGFSLSDGIIFGFDSEYDLMSILDKSISLGFSYIGRNQNSSIPDGSNFNKTTSMFSGRINFSNDNFYTNAEYIFKDKEPLVEAGDIIDSRLFDGNALLFNIGYTKKGIGIDATFRRIENFSIYADRESYANQFNDQIVNYIPSLTKQHSFSLANIYVYQSQPQISFNPIGRSGEIGFQTDFFYKLSKGSTLGGKYGVLISVNYSQWNRLNANYNLDSRTYNTKFLKFGDKNFHDFNLEIHKKWSPSLKTILTYMNLYYDKKFIEEKVGQVQANIVSGDVKYRFNSTKSLHLVLQHLWSMNDVKNWVASSLSYNFSSSFSLFVDDMYNYGNDVKFDRIHYYNFGSTYTKGNTSLSLGYGRQRGGLICLGGICRFVPNSTGLSFGIRTSL